MAKNHDLVRSLMQKSSQNDSEFKEGFEAVKTQSIGISLNAELTQSEKIAIQKILADDYLPGKIPESHVEQHVQQLTRITMQIKSIRVQSALLHGERIKEAQNLLANYKEGAFSKWLMSVYGNRQSPYNMLRFYEFHQSASKETRPLIESAPKKAIYLLASCKADQNTKLDFIQKHATASQSDLVLLIRETFQPPKKVNQESIIRTIVDKMESLYQDLKSRAEHFDEKDCEALEGLIKHLQDLSRSITTLKP